MTIIETSNPFQEGKIQNLAAYFLSAVKNNYQPPKNTSQDPHQEVVVSFELADLKRQAEQIRRHYNLYRERAIHDVIHGLIDEEKNKFMKAFFSYAEPIINTILELQSNKYTQENVLDSPQMQALLRQYALRELDMTTLPTLEEFVAQQGDEKFAAWRKFKSYDPDHPCFNE